NSVHRPAAEDDAPLNAAGVEPETVNARRLGAVDINLQPASPVVAVAAVVPHHEDAVFRNQNFVALVNVTAEIAIDVRPEGAIRILQLLMAEVVFLHFLEIAHAGRLEP